VERSLLEDQVEVLLPRRPALALPPEATVGDAIRTLLEHNIGAVSIIDDSGRLLGIFSERDVLMRVVGRVPTPPTGPSGK